MRRNPRLSFVPSWVSALLVLALVLGMVTPGFAQEKEKMVVPYEGSQAFLHLLGIYKLRPIKTISDLGNHQPHETVIIVFGSTRVLKEINEQIGTLENFRQQGGAILIASDRKFFRFGLTSGPSIQEHKENSFRGFPDCPLIKDNILDRRHPIFKGITRGIATNHPVLIDPGPAPVLTRLATFTSPHVHGFNMNGLGAYIWGSSWTAGPEDRVLVMGGHGIFFNGMMVQSKYNDNFLFANNCVDWLTDGRKKKYVLFVEEGKVHTKIDVPLAHIPPIPLPTEEKINQMLKILQDEDVFHRFLFSMVRKDDILRVLFIGLTILIAFRLLVRLFRGRFRQEPRLPLVARTLEKTTSERTVFAQRYSAMIGEGNLREVARAVARQWLEEQGMSECGKGPPVVEAASNPRQQRNWQKDLNYLWNLAWGRKKMPFAPRQLRTLMEKIDQLNQEVQQEKLRLKPS